MIDNEIIQEATEAVTKGIPCAFYVPLLLDVINRQKAEIERLQKEIEWKKSEIWILEEELEKAEDLNDALGNDVDIKLKHIYDLGEKLSKAKSEAYREFADILVDKAVGSWQPKVSVATITDTLKELTGEKRNVEH